MHTLRLNREDEDSDRTVKLLAVSSLGRIVVYSELQPSDDRVKVSVQLWNTVCVCWHCSMCYSLCCCVQHMHSAHATHTD